MQPAIHPDLQLVGIMHTHPPAQLLDVGREPAAASSNIGPGSIDQAHKADEFIAVAELERCGRFLDQLVAHCRG
jgi:acetylornithine deacetylase/succinyl-diaminopimelate desuccinylase-like protein